MVHHIQVVRIDGNDLAIQTRIQIEREFFPQGLTPENIRLVDRVEQISQQSFSYGYKIGSAIQADEWSNNACLGYAIKGARRLGLTDEQTRKLIRSIYSTFDDVSVDEAKRTYENSPY